MRMIAYAPHTKCAAREQKKKSLWDFFLALAPYGNQAYFVLDFHTGAPRSEKRALVGLFFHSLVAPVSRILFPS